MFVASGPYNRGRDSIHYKKQKEKVTGQKPETSLGRGRRDAIVERDDRVHGQNRERILVDLKVRIFYLKLGQGKQVPILI